MEEPPRLTVDNHEVVKMGEFGEKHGITSSGEAQVHHRFPCNGGA